MLTRLHLALLPLLLAALTARAECPPEAPSDLLERFVAASCLGCWKEQPPQLRRSPRAAWVLDWVVPGPTAAALSAPRPSFFAAAALPAATARLARHGPLRADEALTISHPLPQRGTLDVLIGDTRGPQGQIELSLVTRFNSPRLLSDGLQGWMALVERVAAGDEASSVDRQVVRALIGPLPLEDLARHPIIHTRTLTLQPLSAAGQLAAVGWIENPRGRIIAAGTGPLPDCPAP